MVLVYENCLWYYKNAAQLHNYYYYCLENVNKIFIDCYPTNSYRIILNSEYSATSGDFSRKRRVLSFSLLNPLLFSITLYTTTLSALLLYYYYYCEYWMLDHITRLYAVDICTNWVVLGSVIIESEQNIFYHKVSFFVQCTKMQLITLQNFNIKTCFSQFLWFFSLKCCFKCQIISRIHLSLPNAYKLMCFDRNINENRDDKFLKCD